ncbi:pentatricopeptide repeat-containing protein At1g26460, mitochondrial-like [Coffea arabica]|uniref:Pentatricopeptide repeat-containing protein At1g26460, mitochondrial-like n=1 Tax=Coffea arabica TaxID=13443 RepID=A0A6P6VEK9_COFAR|nr:pentatricopeptide repeat-containing protein At1g26460, mitochondrial-like [Coffea arabica]
MASMAIFSRSRTLMKILNHHNPHHDFTIFKPISTFPFLSQEAQLAEPPPPPSPSQTTTSTTSTATSLPPNPASGSPLYNQNWRNRYPPSLSENSSSLMPVGIFNQRAGSRSQALSQTLDVQGLMDLFADWMTSQRWNDMKQLFELWVMSLDNNGKPNRPDVSLYNHYLRANLMLGASAAQLLELVSQMDDFNITPNTASFNLVLKSMVQAREIDAAEKLLERMLQTGKEYKESLPDDESYDLVLGMLFATGQIDTAMKFMDVALDNGYMLAMSVFNECVLSCLQRWRLDSLMYIIQRCKKMEQNKALCPSWDLCNHIADVAMQANNSELVFYALEFMARWIRRGQTERPQVLLSVDEGLLVSVLATAGRTYSSKLLDASWSFLKSSLRQKKIPNPESCLAKIYAYSSLGNLPKAFGTLRELEASYSSADNEALEDLFSPFTSLNPLVLACSNKGFATLDEVYYQLENLSQANPPYKSVAALNCVVLGCANIWDVDRAYQTFSAIDASFGLTPDIHSYNSLICAFGKLNKRDEATKVFEHFVSLGVKANATTYCLLVDAHLVKRDSKAAISVIQDMVTAGYEPSKEMLKKIRRRCIREMDYESDEKVVSFASQFKIRMNNESRRNMLFNLDYSTEYA